MPEIDFTFKFPAGDPVIRGKIPLYIPPDAIEAIIERDPVFVHDSAFSDYFQLRLAEHGLDYEGTKRNWSAERNEELENIRESIAEFEKENPTFQKELTDHLNSIIDPYR